MSIIKTRKFLIATHGTFAGGIRSSLDIIIGQVENLFLIEAYVNENKSIEDEVSRVMKNVSAEDELLIFTDLLGGSITNQLAKYALQDNIHIISGFNLPLLVEILLADNETPIKEIIDSALINAKAQLVYVNELMNTDKASHD